MIIDIKITPFTRDNVEDFDKLHDRDVCHNGMNEYEELYIQVSFRHDPSEPIRGAPNWEKSIVVVGKVYSHKYYQYI